jgi:type IV pilus assembly protein PilE
MNKRQQGFTLLELMVVVVVIGILAGIAYPSYLDSVRKARRTDAQAAITNVQIEQQKLRASCRFFGGTIGAASNCDATAGASTVRAAAASPDGWYTITLANASATGYTVTATPQRDQVNDDEAGVACTMVLTVSAANPNGARTPAACWN